ncbi:MAG: hypothetical protein QW837_07620 [Conexivisphaerales archaeon]
MGAQPGNLGAHEPDGAVAKFYRKLAKKTGKASAVVAASAKLLKIIYWVLKEQRPYRKEL